MQFRLSRKLPSDYVGLLLTVSTATPFRFRQAFPFCASDISGSLSGFAYIDNLTLAQAMAFAWNFESFTLTTSGTVSKSGDPDIDGATVFTLSPIASTIFDEARTRVDMWIGSSPTSMTAYGSFPNIREPRARVCYLPSNSGALLSLYTDQNSDAAQNFDIELYVGTDPGNSGKYRIYYSFDLYRGNGLDTQAIRWMHQSSPPSGYTSLNSGTVTIGGHTFNYYSYYIGTSATGGTMSASSGSFTY